VVAEPAVAAGLGGDDALHGAGGRHLPAVRPTDQCHRLEAGRAPFDLDAGQLPEQLGDVVGVTGVLAGEAGRVDARGAAESVDEEAGVVGHGRVTGGGGDGGRLEPGVLHQGGPGLVDVGDVGRPGEELETRHGRRQDGRDLGGLVGVGRGEDEAHYLPRGGGGVASSSAWASRISAMPCSASDSRSSSSALENALPSAVPWTSTKRPEVVMTTFMSTSAFTSST